jgi:hypothetical protein
MEAMSKSNTQLHQLHEPVAQSWAEKIVFIRRMEPIEECRRPASNNADNVVLLAANVLAGKQVEGGFHGART